MKVEGMNRCSFKKKKASLEELGEGHLTGHLTGYLSSHPPLE